MELTNSSGRINSQKATGLISDQLRDGLRGVQGDGDEKMHYAMKRVSDAAFKWVNFLFFLENFSVNL